MAMTLWRQVRRVVRVTSYAALTVGTGYSLIYLHRHDWRLSSTGIVRFGRAAITAGSIVIDYKRTLRNLDAESAEYQALKSQVHTRSANKLYDLCCVNGGSFIKVGQHVGSLDYLLPSEYVNALRVLHSDAPQSPVKELYKVIHEDLGKPVNEIFTTFDDKPLGAASLAQVHKATLHDGTVVAVKVQHPHVKAHSLVDLATMELLIHGVAWLFPEFQFLWLAEESKRNLPLELDFIHEANNCIRVDRMLTKFSYLKVPRIYTDLTTSRVLTMEYCEGGQINDHKYIKENNINVDEVACKLGELYSEMIFVQGYIHCDPHPGNILVNQTNKGLQIVLLDHGLYQTLTDDFRINYCKLWISIIQADLKGIEKYSQRMGTEHLYPLFACMVTGRSWNAVRQGVDKATLTEDEDEEIRTQASRYVPQISDILNKVPREMLLIFKTNDLLRGIETNLKTRANTKSFITMSKSCVRALYSFKSRFCDGWRCRLRITMKKNFTLFLINLYVFKEWLGSLHIWRKSNDYISDLNIFNPSNKNGEGTNNVTLQHAMVT